MRKSEDKPVAAPFRQSWSSRQNLGPNTQMFSKNNFFRKNNSNQLHLILLDKGRTQTLQRKGLKKEDYPLKKRTPSYPSKLWLTSHARAYRPPLCQVRQYFKVFTFRFLEPREENKGKEGLTTTLQALHMGFCHSKLAGAHVNQARKMNIAGTHTQMSSSHHYRFKYAFYYNAD